MRPDRGGRVRDSAEDTRCRPPWCRRYLSVRGGHDRHAQTSLSSRLRILPLGPSGSSARNSTRRVLVLPQPLPRPCTVRPRASSRRPERSTTTAQISSPYWLVGQADDRDLGDRRVAQQHLLDLARVDVVAAADDQVLLAVDDATGSRPRPCVPRSPVRNQPSTIAAAVASGLVEVAGEDVVPAQHDLAELARRGSSSMRSSTSASAISDLDAPDRAGRRCRACGREPAG